MQVGRSSVITGSRAEASMNKNVDGDDDMVITMLMFSRNIWRDCLMRGQGGRERCVRCASHRRVAEPHTFISL